MSTRVDALAAHVRHCRRCDNVIPFGRSRRIYCSEHCQRLADQEREKERRKARAEVYKTLGLPARSNEPTCDSLLAAGYDRYCPICGANYRPGEPKRCGCARPLQAIEWHIPQEFDLQRIARAIDNRTVGS
jgi:predicted nucleic acid-binding Zn ribbon protein